MGSVLDGIRSKIGDGSFDLPCISNDVSWGISKVNVEFQFAPDCLQPRRELARPSALVSLYILIDISRLTECVVKIERFVECHFLTSLQSRQVLQKIRCYRVIGVDHVPGDH